MTRAGGRLGALALVYGAVAFLPMLRNSFWADDFGWVSRAMDAYAAPGRWLDLAKTDFRPLAGLSFILNLALSGVRPAGYYAFNLILHLSVTALVMMLTRRVSGSPIAAGLAGLLFAGGVGHYGEAIVWICGRTGPLADLFVLGSLIFQWDALERGRRRDRVLSVACFALALLAKESAVIALPLLLLLEWTHPAPGAPSPGARLARYAPFALLLAGYLAFQLAVVRAGSPTLGSEYVLGPHAAAHLVEYLARMVMPVVPSSMLVPVPAALRKLLPLAFVTLEACLPLLWLGVVLKPGMPRAVRFGLLWMPIALLPVVFFTFRTSTRYLYEPAIGLAMVLGQAAAAVWTRVTSGSRAPARRGALAALIVLLAAQAAVMQVVIRRHRLEQQAQGPAPYRELKDHARSLGLE